MWIAKALDILTPKAGFSVCEDNIDKIEWFSEDIERPSNDVILSKVSELKAAEPMRLLRVKRNVLLSETDWWAVADRTMTPAQIHYREALRNMPTDNPNVALNEAGELINITWPTEPQ